MTAFLISILVLVMAILAMSVGPEVARAAFPSS